MKFAGDFIKQTFCSFQIETFCVKEKKKPSFMTLQWSALSYYHTALPVFCVCIWPRSEIPLTICYERGRDRAERMWQNMKCVWSVWKQMSKTCSFLLLLLFFVLSTVSQRKGCEIVPSLPSDENSVKLIVCFEVIAMPQSLCVCLTSYLFSRCRGSGE